MGLHEHIPSLGQLANKSVFGDSRYATESFCSETHNCERVLCSVKPILLSALLYWQRLYETNGLALRMLMLVPLIGPLL